MMAMVMMMVLAMTMVAVMTMVTENCLMQSCDKRLHDKQLCDKQMCDKPLRGVCRISLSIGVLSPYNSAVQIKGIAQCTTSGAEGRLSRLVLGYTNVPACIYTATYPTTHPDPSSCYKPIWETVHRLHFAANNALAYPDAYPISLHTLYPLHTPMHTLHLCIASPRPGKPIGLLVAKQSGCMHPYIHQRNHSCRA